MCDTLISTRITSANGVAVFGKNSDRHPNEGQHLAYIPAQTYPAGSRLKCTYIEVPQAEHTYAAIISKPFWMWGAEMGVNEYGLTIGNEAIFSKIPANKEPALLGMDMLRIALERAKTPREGVEVITRLLEEFGQGGNGGLAGNPLYYHNTFILANADDAWVLETVDKQWAARQIKDVYSISNCLTLDTKFDLTSPGLVNLAVEKGFSKSAQRFHYAKDYSDFIFTTFGKGTTRRASTLAALEKQNGTMNAEQMIAILRGHTSANPQEGFASMDICMHASFGPIRASQTTASFVASLDGKSPLVFTTGTSSPCTSIYKPLWVDAPMPDFGEIPGAEYDSKSLFWQHEKLHRATLLNYPERIKVYEHEKNDMEKRFIDGALALHGKASAAERGEFAAACFREAAHVEAEWLARIEQIPAHPKYPHAFTWKQFNAYAKMPILK